MAATLNLHKVFAGSGGYLEKLKVPPADEIALRRAREEIRFVLRGAFREWERYVSRVELFEGLLLKSAPEAKLPQPKFRLQGSFAYHTVNDCQQTPPQQIDQDDGLFLPIGFLAGERGTRPRIASKAYFKIVEDALRPLCERKGWVLNPGPRPKDTCVRIEISARIHIDLPLYAIRDEAFERLVETTLAKSLARAMTADEADAGHPSSGRRCGISSGVPPANSMRRSTARSTRWWPSTTCVGRSAHGRRTTPTSSRAWAPRR